MTDAALQFTVETKEVKGAALDFSKLAVETGRAEKATDAQARSSGRAEDALSGLRDELQRTIAEANRIRSLMDQATGSLSKFERETIGAAQATDKLAAAQKHADAAMHSAAKASGIASRAGLDLSRQLADVGVSAAMGISPLMILIQQGPQIADSLGVAASAGIGLRGVLAGLYAQVAPLAAVLAPVALAVGAVAGGFALFHRELAKGYPKDITDGLGLTEEQLKRVENRTVTFGDTFMATLTVIGDRIMNGPVGGALGWLGDRFGEIMDVIGKAAVNGTANLIGVFVATYQTIVKHWRQFPQMMNALVARWVNFGIENMERFVNVSIHGLNRVLEVMSKITGKKFEPFKDMDFGRIDTTGNPAAATFNETRAATAAAVRAALSDFGRDVQSAAVKRAQTRAKEEAGDPRKGRTRTARDPRDMTDERSAQVDQLIAQAKAEELRAQLDITKDIKKRAEIEKQIAATQLAGKQAQLDRQIAAIWDDKGLSDIKKLELAATLEVVKGVQARTAGIQNQKIDEDAARALAKEALDLEITRLDGQATILAAQAEIALGSLEQRKLQEQIRDIDIKIAKAKLRDLALYGDTPAERERAQLQLEAAEEAERIRKTRKPIEDAQKAFQAVARDVDDVADAFRRGDWNAAVTGVLAAIKNMEAAFSKAGSAGDRIGAMAGLASAAGSIVGGKAGNALMGAGSGALAGAQIGSIIPGIGTAIGAGVGAIIGGLGSLFGSSSAKKKAERQRQQQLADARVQQEIALLQAQGKALEAVAKAREHELSKLDPTLRAVQQAIWNAEDSLRIQQQGHELQARFVALGDELNGTNEALLNARKAEMEATDPLNRWLLELVNTREDEVKALEKQRQIAAARQDIEIQLMEATGDAAGALAAKRAIERAEMVKLDASLGPLIDKLWQTQDATAAAAAAEERRKEAQAAADKAVNDARGVLQQAYDRQSGIFNDIIAQWRQVAERLGDYAMGILSEMRGVGGSGRSSYATAQAEFRRLVALGPNADYEDLQRAGDAYRAASKNYQSDSLGYLSDLSEIYAAVDQSKKYAEVQIDDAQKQLDLMTLQHETLQEIKTGILSFPDAIASLRSAIAAATAANDNGSRNTRGDLAPGGLFEGYTREQLYSWQALEGEARSPYSLPSGMFNAWNTLQQLKAMGVNIPGFKTGGSFQVGGSGGADSQLVKMWASPKEYVSVSHTDPQAANDALVAEIRGLRMEVAAMRRDTSDTAKNTRNTDDTLTRVTQGGDAMLTEAA